MESIGIALILWVLWGVVVWLSEENKTTIIIKMEKVDLKEDKIQEIKDLISDMVMRDKNKVP